RPGLGVTGFGAGAGFGAAGARAGSAGVAGVAGAAGAAFGGRRVERRTYAGRGLDSVLVTRAVSSKSVRTEPFCVRRRTLAFASDVRRRVTSPFIEVNERGLFSCSSRML